MQDINNQINLLSSFDNSLSNENNLTSQFINRLNNYQDNFNFFNNYLNNSQPELQTSNLNNVGNFLKQLDNLSSEEKLIDNFLNESKDLFKKRKELSDLENSVLFGSIAGTGYQSTIGYNRAMAQKFMLDNLQEINKRGIETLSKDSKESLKDFNNILNNIETKKNMSTEEQLNKEKQDRDNFIKDINTLKSVLNDENQLNILYKNLGFDTDEKKKKAYEYMSNKVKNSVKELENYNTRINGLMGKLTSSTLSKNYNLNNNFPQIIIDTLDNPLSLDDIVNNYDQSMISDITRGIVDFGKKVIKDYTTSNPEYTLFDKWYSGDDFEDASTISELTSSKGVLQKAIDKFSLGEKTDLNIINPTDVMDILAEAGEYADGVTGANTKYAKVPKNIILGALINSIRRSNSWFGNDYEFNKKTFLNYLDKAKEVYNLGSNENRQFHDFRNFKVRANNFQKQVEDASNNLKKSLEEFQATKNLLELYKRKAERFPLSATEVKDIQKLYDLSRLKVIRYAQSLNNAQNNWQKVNNDLYIGN